MKKQYTEKEKRTIRGTLRRVKRWVKLPEDVDVPGTGKTTAICFGLDRIPDLSEAANQLVTDMIADKLWPSTFIEDWLEKNVPDYDHHLPDRDREVQAYRHRWIDALIEEFSK